MMKIFGLFLAASLVLATSATEKQVSGETPAKQRVVIGYITGGAWPKGSITAEKLTHINYAFGKLMENGELANLGAKDAAHIKELVALKEKNRDLKILISVGGWGGCKYFSDTAFTETARRKFAVSAVRVMKQYALDGVDIDWEYPGQIGNNNKFRAEDKENYTLLLKALRERMDDEGKKDGRRYLLTIATGADAAFVSHTDLGQAQRYVDYVNLMAYDIYNGNDRVTGHLSNLYQSKLGDQSRSSVDDAVKEHLAAGVPAGKIVLGLPFYGRGWTEVNGQDNGLYQPSAGKTWTRTDDELSESYINTNGYVRYWDRTAKAPYLWNPETRTFVTYDDAESFAGKVDYVKAQGLAGIMFWEYKQQAKSGNLLDGLVHGLNQ